MALRLPKIFAPHSARPLAGLVAALLVAGCQGPWVDEFKADPSHSGPRSPSIGSVTVPPLSNTTTVQTIPFTISDAAGPVSCRDVVSTQSSNQGVVPATYMDVTGTAPNCVLTVRPAPGSSGTTTITLTADTGNGPVSTSFPITTYGSPSVSGTPVPIAIKGTAYAGFTVTGSVGLAPYTYTIQSGSLPAGITLNASTGAVSGTPTVGGKFASIVIRATDSAGGTASLAPFDLYVASYDLDFTASSTFPAAVAFARGSAGTRTNSAGTLEVLDINAGRLDYDPVTHAAKGLLVEEPRVNLLKVGEGFAHAWWTKGAASVSSAGVTAPDGRAAGDLLAEDATNNIHYLTGTSQTKTAASLPYVFSIYAKANGARSAVSLMIGNSALTSGVQATCDLSAVNTINAGTVGSGWSNAKATVTAQGNGWYRCSLAGISDATNSVNVGVGLYNGGATYTGSAGQGLYIWGAQLEQASSISSYIPARNLLSYTEELTNGVWTASSLGATSTDVATSPAGTVTVDEIQDNNFGALGYLAQTTAIPADNSPYTASVYVQKNAGSIVAVYLSLTGGTTSSRALAVDTTNGNYSSVTGIAAMPTNVAVADAGSFWRVSFTNANNASGNTSATIRLYPAIANNLGGGGGNTTTSTFLTDSAQFWGAQVERGSAVSPYVRSSSVAFYRDADHARLASLGSWFSASEGTFVSSSTLPSVPVAAASPLSFTDGSLNNRLTQTYTATSAALEIYSGSAAQGGATKSLVPAGTLNFATGYLYNDAQLALAGSLGTGGAPGAIPTVNILYFGASGSASNYLNGYIRRFTYWGNRLPNSILPLAAP